MNVSGVNNQHIKRMEQESAKLQKLKQRHADLLLQIRREQQKLARDERRRDTRRKILVGAIMLMESERNAQWKDRLMQLLDQHLEREGDRALFELKVTRSE